MGAITSVNRVCGYGLEPRPSMFLASYSSWNLDQLTGYYVEYGTGITMQVHEVVIRIERLVQNRLTCCA